MPIDFTDLLSGKTLDRLEREEHELRRIFTLPDRFLGRELMKLVRQARSEDPERLGTATGSFYENTLAWSVIPGLARRLGETAFDAEELNAMTPLPDDPAELRQLIGSYLKNSRLLPHGVAPDTAPACALLDHAFVNGNPVAIALDRVAPPSSESSDWIAKHTREISRARFGEARFNGWEPAMQNYERVEVDSPFAALRQRAAEAEPEP